MHALRSPCAAYSRPVLYRLLGLVKGELSRAYIISSFHITTYFTITADFSALKRYRKHRSQFLPFNLRSCKRYLTVFSALITTETHEHMPCTYCKVLAHYNRVCSIPPVNITPNLKRDQIGCD